jgi:hypothetical protein
MDRRYQIFVSSTFRDLVEERREVMQALLEMDCIPAGMELFPAASEAACKLIQRVIEESDYYCLIVGGRYGSMDKRGISFTEREYDYATKISLPIVSFLHGNPDSIPVGKVDRDEKASLALQEFRSKVEKRHHCKYWVGPEDLGGKVSRSLLQLFKLTPRVGWVRADQIPSTKVLADLERFRRQAEELQERLASFESKPSVFSERLAKGSDRAPFDFSYKIGATPLPDSPKADQTKIEVIEQIPISWDEIFTVLGSCILAGDYEWRMHSAIEKRILEIKRKDRAFVEGDGGSVEISHVVMNSLVVQFVALGLI